MSTQSPIRNQQAPSQPGPGPQPTGRRSRFRIWAAVIGAAVVAVLVVLAVALFHGNSSSTPAGTSPSNSSTSTSAPANPANPAVPANPTSPATPTHPTHPSAAVEKLQQELGQLNYYEGPVNGIMTPQTVQAIKYLQRDAHLPQTGEMNAATQAALANFLAHGNNQMGGNS